MSDQTETAKEVAGKAIGKYGLDRRWLLEGQTADKDIWSESLPLVFPDIHCTSGSGRRQLSEEKA